MKSWDPTAGGTRHFGTAENSTSSLTSESPGAVSSLNTMEQLATSAAGRSFTTNDIDAAFRRIVEDGDVYYTVGQAPSDSATNG